MLILYKFYTQKAIIEYKPLNDKKLIKFDNNILKLLNQVYDKYPSIFKIEDEFDRMFKIIFQNISNFKSNITYSI